MSGSEDAVSSGDLFADNGSGIDNDPDGDIFTVSEVNGVAGNVSTPTAGDNGGSFTINPDGTYSFGPSSDFDDLAVGETRDTTITYTIDDGEGGTDTATVTVTVAGVNDAPQPIDPITGLTPADPTDYIPSQIGDDNGTMAVLDLAPYFTDTDVNDVLSISVNPADLPPGMSFDPLIGIISGMPDADASQGGPNGNGVYTVSVMVDDGNGGTFTTNIVYTISNPVPIAQDDAVSGNEDSISAGNLFADNGNGLDSDPDGDVFTVTEVNGAPANVSASTAGDNGGSFTINPDGTYSFDPSGGFDDLAVGETRDTTITYTIDDGEGGTDMATVTMTVVGVNDAPQPIDPLTGNPPADPQNYIPAQTGDDSGSMADFDLTPYFGEDDGSDSLGISIDPSDIPPGMVFDPLTGVISGTPNLGASQGGSNSDGVYTIPVTIDDGNGGTFTTNITYTITNPAPIAQDDGPIDVNEDEALVIDVQDNDLDPDGDVTTITHVNGHPIAQGDTIVMPSGSTVTLNPDGTLEYEPAENLNGLDSFEYTLTDADGASDTASVDVNILPVNDVPDTDANLQDQQSTDGETIAPLNISGSFSDIDDDVLNYSAVGLPSGLNIDPQSGSISGTLAPNASANGPYIVTITASDPSGDSISTDFAWGVDNIIPEVTAPIGPQSGVDGEPVNIAAGNSFIDPDGDLVTYTVSGLPAGLSIDPQTGDITGTLPNDSAANGPYAVTVTATDAQGASVSDIFELTSTNPVPVLLPMPPMTVNIGEPFTVDVSIEASDLDGDALTYSATNLPQGLSIDPVTGMVSGIPTVPASSPYLVEITVADGQGGTAVQILEITVNEDVYVSEIGRSVILPLGADVVGAGQNIDQLGGLSRDGLSRDGLRSKGENSPGEGLLDLTRIFEERDRDQTLRDVLENYDYQLRGGMARAAGIAGLGEGSTVLVEGVAHENSIFVTMTETIEASTRQVISRWEVSINGGALPAWIDYAPGSDYLILNRTIADETVILRISAVLENGRRISGNFEIDMRTGEVELIGAMSAQSATLSQQFAQLAETERSKDKALLEALSG